MKKMLVIVFLSIFITYLCGCENKVQDKSIEFSVETYIDETVNNGDHKRNVKIMRLESNSNHADKINEEICLKFESIYNDFLGNRDFFYEGLVIDYTYHVENDILSITAIADVPSENTEPLASSSIYLDLRNDILYSAEEYAFLLEIDTKEIINDLSKRFFGSYPPKLGGIFHNGNDVIFVFDTKESSSSTHSFFYNYTKGTFGRTEAFHFTGFNTLKVDSKELATYTTNTPDSDGLPSAVKLAGNNISFRNKIGREQPIYFTEFLTKYGDGIFGDVEIKKILVEEAMIDVYTDSTAWGLTDQTLFAAAVTAFGHTYEFVNPIELGSLNRTIAYFTDEYFIFSGSEEKTVIITEKGVECFENTYDGNDLVTEFYIAYDGTLSYIKRPVNYPIDYENQSERILRNCKGKEDFCREYGHIEIIEGTVGFAAERTLTADEAYDLEGMLEELYSTYDVATVNSRLSVPGATQLSLDELLAYNAERADNSVSK